MTLRNQTVTILHRCQTVNASPIDIQVAHAAEAIASAEAIVIGAGAGMGVDSGLPDFRGDQGFWKAYPPFRGRQFAEVSNPIWFDRDPAQAWGFFGHRLNLYRNTTPHEGFTILRRWSEQRPLGYFVFTSNVDGHFQRAGFSEDHIVECHGSIHYLQCCRPCGTSIWSAERTDIAVDDQTIRAVSTVPTCTECGSLARPNILMFGDFAWVAQRWQDQQQRYVAWLNEHRNKRLAIIEFGAGLAVPTVRYQCEQVRGTLIRVNPRDYRVPAGAISIPLGAWQAIQRIDALL